MCLHLILAPNLNPNLNRNPPDGSEEIKIKIKITIKSGLRRKWNAPPRPVGDCQRQTVGNTLPGVRPA